MSSLWRTGSWEYSSASYQMTNAKENKNISMNKWKQEYFLTDRYPTILSIVSIATTLPIVCICLTASQRAVSDPPSHPPGMTRCTAFNAPECTAAHTCGQRPFSPLHISLYIHVHCRWWEYVTIFKSRSMMRISPDRALHLAKTHRKRLFFFINRLSLTAKIWMSSGKLQSACNRSLNMRSVKWFK